MRTGSNRGGGTTTSSRSRHWRLSNPPPTSIHSRPRISCWVFFVVGQILGHLGQVLESNYLHTGKFLPIFYVTNYFISYSKNLFVFSCIFIVLFSFFLFNIFHCYCSKINKIGISFFQGFNHFIEFKNGLGHLILVLL